MLRTLVCAKERGGNKHRAVTTAAEAAIENALCATGWAGLILVEKIANVIFIAALADQADVHGGNSSPAVDDEGGGKIFDTAILSREIFIGDHHAVIDFALFEVGFDGIPTVIVEGGAEHHEVAILIGLLKLDEPGDLDLARLAPGGPKIQEHHFAVIIGKFDRLTGDVLEREIGRDLAFLFGLDSGLDVVHAVGAGEGSGTDRHHGDNGGDKYSGRDDGSRSKEHG